MNNFAIPVPSFVHEELSSLAWKLKHIQTISIPVNVNPLNIFSAEPFIERYLVSLCKTLKTSTWKMCSSFLWLKFSNIQPNGGSNPHGPLPKQTPVQRLPVDLHQGEPRRADMADEMWKCAEMIVFSLVSIVFPVFLVKYNSKWTTTDNLKRGCLPDSCTNCQHMFKKNLRVRQIWQRSIYTPWN